MVDIASIKSRAQSLEDDITQTESEIKRLNARLSSRQSELRRLFDTCTHVWDQVRSTPIRTGGYLVEGDPPGVGGIDRRLPMYVSATETPCWTRTCVKCGKVETTESSRSETRQVPRF